MALTPLRGILAGAASSGIGIVLAAAGQTTLGGALTLAGWAALVWGVHRFGRGKKA